MSDCPHGMSSVAWCRKCKQERLEREEALAAENEEAERRRKQEEEGVVSDTPEKVSSIKSLGLAATSRQHNLSYLRKATASPLATATQSQILTYAQTYFEIPQTSALPGWTKTYLYEVAHSRLSLEAVAKDATDHSLAIANLLFALSQIGIADLWWLHPDINVRWNRCSRHSRNFLEYVDTNDRKVSTTCLFSAKYVGTCSFCGEVIQKGDVLQGFDYEDNMIWLCFGCGFSLTQLMLISRPPTTTTHEFEMKLPKWWRDTLLVFHNPAMEVGHNTTTGEA